MIEAQWFLSLSDRLSGSRFRRIGGRGDNPSTVDELIRYDRPDIILLNDGRPILVIEKTREVPTGHNVGQRMARLVRAVEMGVPTIYYFPFDARKHGKHTSICNLNIRIVSAFFNMARIHNTPALAINWPSTTNGELIVDGSEDERVKTVVEDYLGTENPWCPEVRNQMKLMEDEYDARLRRYPEYGSPPSSVEMLGTSRLCRSPELASAPPTFASRTETVVYTIGMTPEKCRREDPYTGTQFIYDYLWCRNGPRVADKKRNLVLKFPLIDEEIWHRCNPDDDGRKSCNWYLTANCLWFRNGAVFLR
jgi:hypothetical protein